MHDSFLLQQEKVKRCLDILKVSMGNTIISFRDKYYEYEVDPNPDRHQGLTIGGLKSAFLTDLEATYLFEKLNHIFEAHTKLIDTYHNDKIIVFRGNQSNEWLSS